MLSTSENFVLLQNVIFALFQKFKNFWRILTWKIPRKLVFLSINGNHCNSYLCVHISAVCCWIPDRDTILICDAKWTPQRARRNTPDNSSVLPNRNLNSAEHHTLVGGIPHSNNVQILLRDKRKSIREGPTINL